MSCASTKIALNEVTVVICNPIMSLINQMINQMLQNVTSNYKGLLLSSSSFLCSSVPVLFSYSKGPLLFT